MNIFLLSIVLLTIVGIFLQRWAEIKNDANVGPAELSFNDWLRHSAVEMTLNLILFVALALGVNVDSLIKAADTVASGIGTYSDVTSIAGAFATGSAIYKVVQLTLLPLWNVLTGATTARKKLRTNVSAELSKE
jgi:hypothetical protein